MLYVNGRALPRAAEITVNKYDLVDEAGRSPENGKLFVKYIASKVKIDAVWRFLSDDEVSSLVATVDQSKPFFQLQYRDASGMRTIEAYRGDVKYGLKLIRGDKAYWADVSIAFIER